MECILTPIRIERLGTPKCDMARWSKTHLHQSHSNFNKQSHFQKQHILGLNQRLSLKSVLRITGLALDLHEINKTTSTKLRSVRLLRDLAPQA
jgi:hypothetical protein